MTTTKRIAEMHTLTTPADLTPGKLVCFQDLDGCAGSLVVATVHESSPGHWRVTSTQGANLSFSDPSLGRQWFDLDARHTAIREAEGA